MKKIALFALMFVLSLHAAQSFAESVSYVCQVRNYQVEFDLYSTNPMNTRISIYDQNRYQTVAQAFVGAVEAKGNITLFRFYPGNADPIVLTVRSQDVATTPASLASYIETKLGGFLFWENLSCRAH